MSKIGWSNFVVWQCSIRQRNFRMFSGKPSEGTVANLSEIKTNKELCSIRSVLLEKNCNDTAKMFEFMIKQTNEPEIRFDKIVKLLSSEYYNTPANFDGSLAATFDINSELYKKIIYYNIMNRIDINTLHIYYFIKLVIKSTRSFFFLVIFFKMGN